MRATGVPELHEVGWRARIKALWTLLRNHQKVWVQEHDLGAGYELSVMEFVEAAI